MARVIVEMFMDIKASRANDGENMAQEKGKERLIFNHLDVRMPRCSYGLYSKLLCNMNSPLSMFSFFFSF